MPLNFPPPPPLQFVQGDGKTVSWNWQDWFQKIQALAGHLDLIAGNGLTIVYSGTTNSTATITISDPGGATTILGWAMTKKSVATGQTLNVPIGYQMEVHNTFTISGIVNNSGEIFIEGAFSLNTGSLLFQGSANSGEIVTL